MRLWLAIALSILGGARAHAYLSPEPIRRVVREHIAEIRGCYEAGLASRPDLAGRVVVRIVIATDGHVAGATVTQSTLGAPVVEACIEARVRAWTFPPIGRGSVTVSYPFELRPG